MLLGLGACQGAEQQTEEATAGGDVAMMQEYPNSPAPVALETGHAVVQRLMSEPNQWVGEHGHAGNQLAIALDGGTMIYRQNGEETETTYTPGQPFWIEYIASHDHAAKDRASNAILITMKHSPGGTAMAQEYPARPATTIIDNEYAIVQRIVAEPGQWVGEHSHPGTQIVVFLTGGTMTMREGGEETVTTYEAGQTIEVTATEAHDHANTGTSRIEALLITPKM